MKNKIKGFNIFFEGLDTEDLSNIPGKNPGEPDYIRDVTRRAKERLGISGSREGDMGSISRAGSGLMQEVSRSGMLSRGHERELEKLAESVIRKVFGPILYYNEKPIELDIKMISGPEIRQFIERGVNKTPRDPNQRPIIRARGADFGMLIHEAVKGIWEFLSIKSVAKDLGISAEIERYQNKIIDEPDDWRYGPEIAKDIRDFINENPKTDMYQNLREEVWMYMVSEENLPDEEFLSLIKGILMKTEEARKKIDSIINKVEVYVKERDKWLKEMEKYYLELKAYEESKNISKKILTKKEDINPYLKMSNSELNDLIIDAYERGDIEKAKEISKYLK